MQTSFISIRDQVIVLTGASRGLGLALANGLLNEGARVALVSRSTPPIEHPNALIINADLTTPDSYATVVNQTLKKWGQINGLVNNAGASFPDTTSEDSNAWNKTLEINLNAPFRMSRAVAAVMKDSKQGGSIVNIASIGAHQGFPGNPAYVASKGGLLQLTRALATDWAEFGIRVNSICPGYMQTDMTQASFDDPEKRKARSERTLLKRWGKPSEILGPTILLLSDASSYMTGSSITVDGGWLAKGL